MALKDSATEQRSGNDVLLQEIPDGLIAYRTVQHNPPTVVDFQSHYESGKVPKLVRPYNAYEVLGVSMFLDRAKAQRLVDTAHKRREPAWIAEVELTAAGGAALWGVYKKQSTHLEVFGLPDALLARVGPVS
jgi:hypothetical protein